MTPFEAVYGRAPPIIVSYELGSSLVQEVDVALRTRDEVLRELKGNLELSRQQQKAQADQGRREEEFGVDDFVYLRLRPYRQQTTFRRVYQKLASRFYGPFKVLKRVGKVAYLLELPKGCHIHPVFHVSLLRRCIGATVIEPTSLPPLSEQGVPEIESEHIMGQRNILVHGQSQEQVLIKWRSLPVEDGTWESRDELLRRFPCFKLEDKFVVQGGEDDEPDRAPNPKPPLISRRSMRTPRPTWKIAAQLKQ